MNAQSLSATVLKICSNVKLLKAAQRLGTENTTSEARHMDISKVVNTNFKSLKCKH